MRAWCLCIDAEWWHATDFLPVKIVSKLTNMEIYSESIRYRLQILWSQFLSQARTGKVNVVFSLAVIDHLWLLGVVRRSEECAVSIKQCSEKPTTTKISRHAWLNLDFPAYLVSSNQLIKARKKGWTVPVGLQLFDILCTFGCFAQSISSGRNVQFQWKWEKKVVLDLDAQIFWLLIPNIRPHSKHWILHLPQLDSIRQ